MKLNQWEEIVSLSDIRKEDEADFLKACIKHYLKENRLEIVQGTYPDSVSREYTFRKKQETGQ